MERLLLKEFINVKVTPNSKESCIREFKEGILHIKLKSVPDKGKANKELIKLFKKKYGKNVEIIKGKKIRNKVIRLN